MIALMLVVGLAGLGPASSAEIRDLNVKRHHHRFSLVAHTYLDAPLRDVYDVLTDFGDDAYGRISRVYTDSGYAGHAADGTPLVYTVVHGCVLFFCRNMRRVSRLVVKPPTHIEMQALPARSDFKFSRSVWTLRPEGKGTEITYRLTMEPKFWVPPLVGAFVLKKRFMSSGKHALGNIERLAREESAAKAGDPSAARAARP